MLVFELPYPPSLNTLYKPWHGRFVLTDAGKKYKLQVGWMCKQKRSITSDVAMKITVYPPDKKRRDIANLEKIVCDSLKNGIVYDDDCQISYLVMHKAQVKKNGFIRVLVEEVTDEMLEQFEEWLVDEANLHSICSVNSTYH